MFETSLLMNHYQNCLRERLAIWFEEPPAVSLCEHDLEIHSTPPMGLRFRPQECCWTLLRESEPIAEGSFDRTSKTARRCLSGRL